MKSNKTMTGTADVNAAQFWRATQAIQSYPRGEIWNRRRNPKEQPKIVLRA